MSVVHWQDVSDFLEKFYPRWFDAVELSKKFKINFHSIHGKLCKMRKKGFLESKSVRVDHKFCVSKKVFRFRKGGNKFE